MITNDQHQAAWVAHLKANPATISPVVVAEVREDSWKGDDFRYPCVRVKAVSITPDPNPACNMTEGIIHILVFTEDKSSKICDQVAGAIANYYHGRKFTSSGVKISSTVTTLLAANAESEVTWQATVEIKTLLT